jgi:predicted MFS family arabinose efflux permease
MLLYAFTRGSLLELCVVMAVAGLGVGTSFAGLPTLVVAAVPQRETGSAMSLNQVLRYVGFAIGSALTATVLEAATRHGAATPSSGGYTVIAVIGLVTCGLMLLVTALLPGRDATRS